MELSDEERVFLDARRHGIVLVRPFLKASIAAAAGVVLFGVGWPASAAGSLLLVVAALVALAAVWSWDRTHVVVTSEKLASAGFARPEPLSFAVQGMLTLLACQLPSGEPQVIVGGVVSATIGVRRKARCKPP